MKYIPQRINTIFNLVFLHSEIEICLLSSRTYIICMVYKNVNTYLRLLFSCLYICIYHLQYSVCIYRRSRSRCVKILYYLGQLWFIYMNNDIRKVKVCVGTAAHETFLNYLVTCLKVGKPMDNLYYVYMKVYHTSSNVRLYIRPRVGVR